ncbi:hypothetical protein [Microvirga sp. P5_D2]|jgi:hypothetical protein
MSNRPDPQQRWSTREFAFYGALLGLLVGVVHNYVHAFWDTSYEGDVSTHILTEMVIFIVGGAAGLAAVAAIRNWFRQRP